MWPQIVMLMLIGADLGCTMAKGKPLLAHLIAAAINLGLMYAGGFFACLGA